MSGGAVDVGDLIARLKLDTSGFQKGADEVKQHTRGLEGAIEHLKEEAVEVGKAMLAAFAFEKVVEHLVEFGKEAFDAAVEAQQFSALLKSSFGESADAVTEWSEETGKALHREAGAIGQVATAFNNLLKDTLGPKNSKVARDIAQDLTELSVAFETVHAGGTDAITMALQGRSKALQRMGVDVSDAAVQTDLLAHGEKMLFKDMDESSQAIARTNLLREELTKANKNAGDQTDTWREQTLRLNAIIAENHEKIGNQMLPAMTDLKKTYADMLEKLSSADWTSAFNGIASGFKTIGLMALNAALGISSFLSTMHAFGTALTAAVEVKPPSERYKDALAAAEADGTISRDNTKAQNDEARLKIARQVKNDNQDLGSVFENAFNKAILNSPFTEGLLAAKSALLGEGKNPADEKPTKGVDREDQTHGKNAEALAREEAARKKAAEEAEKERLEILHAVNADTKEERAKQNKATDSWAALEAHVNDEEVKADEAFNAAMKKIHEDLITAYNAEVQTRRSQGHQAMAGWANTLAGGGLMGGLASLMTKGVTEGFGKGLSGDILSAVGAGLGALVDVSKQAIQGLVEWAKSTVSVLMPAGGAAAGATGAAGKAFAATSAGGLAFVGPWAPLAVFVSGAAALGSGMLDLATHTKSYAKYQEALSRATQPLVDAMEPLFENLMPLVGLFSVITKGLAEFLSTLAGGRAIPFALFASLKAVALVAASLNVVFQTVVFSFRMSIDEMVIAMAGFVQFVNEATGGTIDPVNRLAGRTGGAAQRAQADLDTAASNVTGAVDFWQTIMDLTITSAGDLGNSLVDLNKSVEKATSQFNLPSWWRAGQAMWGAALGAPPGMGGGGMPDVSGGSGRNVPVTGGGDRAQIHIHVLPDTKVLVDTVKSSMAADIFRQSADASGIVMASSNIRNRYGG